jgi:glycerophosphoryl diester phosphodiesterase
MKKRKCTASILLSAMLAINLLNSMPRVTYAQEPYGRQEMIAIINETMQGVVPGGLPEGFRHISGDVPGVVELNEFGDERDGKWLKLGSLGLEFSRVQFDMPEGVGDYTIEADFMMGVSTNAQRWASIIYRAQNDTFPYYQFAVRKGKSGGTDTEFAHRTPGNQWDVRVAVANSENFGENIVRRLKVEVSGNNVKEYIDGNLLIDTAQAYDYSQGHIGFQSNYMETYIRNIVVSVPEIPEVDRGKIKTLAINYELDPPLILGPYSQFGSVLPINLIPFAATTYGGETEYFSGDDPRLTYASSDAGIVDVIGGFIMAGNIGLAVVTVTMDEASFDIPIWVKDAGDLFIDENFEDASRLQPNGLPLGFRHISGSLAGVVEVNGNKMLKIGSVNDGFSRIQYDLPKGIGNYAIEADFRFGPSANSSRWASIMFRIQSDANASYYQMAVRKDSTASNGVEFAEMLPNGSWASPQPVATSYREALNENTHKLKVEVSGNKVKEYIDGELIIFTDLVVRYSDGSIGFQTANMDLFIDNIKLSLGTTDLGPLPGETYARAKTLNENIAGSPVVITKLDDMSMLENVINDDVTTSVMVNYTNISDAIALLDATAEKLIPIFVANKMDDAIELAKLVAGGYTDTHMASSDPVIIKAYRDIAKKSRASLIIDREITLADIREVASTAHYCWALNVIVSAGKADKKTIEEIQRRLLSVWMISDDTTVGNHEAVTSGANGIITANPAGLAADASIYDAKTMVRRPFIIAHRGLSSRAPENTLVSYEEAYAAGADIMEIDIYLTKDDEVVLLHDDTFARTTDIVSPTSKLTDAEVAATGRTRANIRPIDLTLEQIKKLDAGSWKSAAYAGEQIPTLREIIEFMKGKDILLFCELKDTNMNVLEPAYEVIRSVGDEMLNQVVFISFNNPQTNYMVANHPDMPYGNLNSVSTDLNNPIKTIHNILNTILPMNSTYNPSYGGLNKAIIAESTARGLTLWPWTINSTNDVRNFIDWGISGITTDYADRTADAVMGILAERSHYAVEAGKTAVINSISLSNIGVEMNLATELVVLKGEENIVGIYGNEITLVPGTSAVVMLKARSYETANSGSYALYSQPVTVTSDGGVDVNLPDFQISYELIATTRVGLTSFDYEIIASVTNHGAGAESVSAVLSDWPASITVIKGNLAFGNIPAGATVTSEDTFTVRIDRTNVFDESFLVFKFNYLNPE